LLLFKLKTIQHKGTKETKRSSGVELIDVVHHNGLAGFRGKSHEQSVAAA
jgi:hypothetical protein